MMLVVLPLHALQTPPDNSYDLNSPNFTVSVSAFTALSSANELPLWIHANRWGILDYDSGQEGSLLELSQLVETPVEGLLFSWHLHGLLLARDEDLNGRFNSAFAQLSYGPLEFAAGSVAVERGLHNGDLSSGSLVMSRNARPIPRIYLAIPDFVSLPLTRGIVEVKGSFSHGWMEENRTVRSPWLHEKDAYLRINDPFNWGFGIYRGLVHSVMWAGTNADRTRRPDTWSDFLRVLTSGSGGEDASVSEQINRLGDTVGMWDAGLTLDRPAFSAVLYHQHFFEDGSGYRMGRGEDWDERWLRLRDGLTGVSLKLSEPRVVDGLTYEYLDTRHQSGPGYHGETGGWDNYWEHGQYGSGWTHYGRVMGPPLVSVAGDGVGLAFTHTRIVAHHVGVSGWVSENTRYRLLGTYSRSFGTYRRNVPSDEGQTINDEGNPDYDPTGGNIRGDGIFRNGRYRWSFLAEATTNSGLLGVDSLFGTVAFGLDIGDLTANTAGLAISVGWRYDQQ